MERDPTTEQLQMVSMFTNVLNEQMQRMRDELTTTASRLNLTLTRQSADLITLRDDLTRRIDDLAQSPSSSNNQPTTPRPTGTNLNSALGSHLLLPNMELGE